MGDKERILHPEMKRREMRHSRSLQEQTLSFSSFIGPLNIGDVQCSFDISTRYVEGIGSVYIEIELCEVNEGLDLVIIEIDIKSFEIKLNIIGICITLQCQFGYQTQQRNNVNVKIRGTNKEFLRPSLVIICSLKVCGDM